MARSGHRAHRARGDHRPGGRAGWRRPGEALLHDGFDTAVSRPVSVKVPDRPTSVEILSPREGEMLVTGGVLRLWGSAVRQDGSPSEERPVRWLLDRREVGTGLDVWLDVPDPGTHRVELVVGESRAKWSSDPSTPRRTSVPTPHGRSHGLTENHLRGAGSRCHKCEEVASRSTNAALRCRSATLRLWGAGSRLHSWVWSCCLLVVRGKPSRSVPARSIRLRRPSAAVPEGRLN